MKVSTFGKATIGLAAAATMGFGLAVPAANAATALTATQEDPTTSTYLGGAAIGANTLVGVGSDTIQDVEYGIGQDLGKQADGTLNFASWTATGTTALTYRSGGTPTPSSAHPNGSGPGYTALKESLGIAPTGADGVAAGDVNFSRASGFQGTEVTGGTGVVTEIPFAIDTISFAVPAGSPFTETNGGAGLKLADLANIYIGTDKYIDTVTGELLPTATPNTSGDATLPIQAYLPKPGSGSRQFFLKDLNAVNSAVALGTNKGDSFQTTNGTPVAGAPYIGNTDLAGKPVVEHDATALLEPAAGTVAAIAPFSGAKFIGYHNGTIADPSGKTAGTDYQLVPFDNATSGAVLPYVNNSGVYAPNSNYVTNGVEGSAKLTREVFNIVATKALTNPTTAIDNAIVSTFAGSTSKICQDTATIQAYGFIVDSKCGNTSRTADVASTSTLTVSNTPAVAGKSTVFTVNVSSNSNGGGTVTLTVNGVAYTGTVARGATSTTITVPTRTAGVYTYGNGANDGFAPNLEGVAPAPINPNPASPLTFKVAKATPTVKAYAARVSHLKVGQVKVVVTAAGVPVTGKVSIIIKNSKGSKVIYLPGKALFHGAVTAKLGNKLKAGKYSVWVTYSGNSNINGKSYAKLATLTVY